MNRQKVIVIIAVTLFMFVCLIFTGSVSAWDKKTTPLPSSVEQTDDVMTPDEETQDITIIEGADEEVVEEAGEEAVDEEVDADAPDEMIEEEAAPDDEAVE